MKQSIIRRLVLALVMLFTTLGLAEELSLNALELPETDMDGLPLGDIIIGDGGVLELPDVGGEIGLPGADGDTGVASEAVTPDAPDNLEALDGTMDGAVAFAAGKPVQDEFILVGETVGEIGSVGERSGQAHYDIPGARADNAALADAYLRGVLPGFGRGGRTMASPGAGRKALVKKGLTATVALYDALKPMIVEIAAGKRTSAEFEFDSQAMGTEDHWWTPAELGASGMDDQNLAALLLQKERIDTSALMKALLQDCPYHLYWFDKTRGWATAYSWSSDGSRVRLSVLQIKLAVADGYAAGTYAVNALPAYVSAAVANIDRAISDNAGKGDHDKLTAYADLICGYVEYNHPAADDDSTPYGDPWQLVWIFDGKADTKVVCEGYAKGFKYLCDLSAFQGNVGCILVEGIMSGGTGEGPHMWNSLKMPDGKCYLVDLTNCDAGDTCNYSLFLKGCSGEACGPYSCGRLRYEFSADLEDRLGGDTSWLIYSNADYDPSAPIPVPTVEPTAKPTAAPTAKPTAAPTAKPTAVPTAKPTAVPTAAPTEKPTAVPTSAPTAKPTAAPTAVPTAVPTAAPTAKPTAAPTTKPTAAPSAKPTAAPTEKPTAAPTAKPTTEPSAKPTTEPTAVPTARPTAVPTATPVPVPIAVPTVAPTKAPAKVDLSGCKITVKDQTYTGKALKPAVTVKYGGSTLKKGTDYTVSYRNNVKPGKATVTVYGKGKYTGAAKATFVIRVPLARCKLTVKDQTYTGKALKPSVTVKYGSKKLKKGTDYTVSYAKNKSVGVATVTVKGRGGYTGTKQLTFRILPRATTVSRLTAGKQRFTVKWTKRAEAAGYELQYALKSSFSGAKTVKVKKAGTISATIKSLKTGKRYYVRVRTWKTVNGKTLYSAWSKAKSVKVK